VRPGCAERIGGLPGVAGLDPAAAPAAAANIDLVAGHQRPGGDRSSWYCTATRSSASSPPLDVVLGGALQQLAATTACAGDLVKNKGGAGRAQGEERLSCSHPEPVGCYLL
jgi:hypothetical protein